MSGQKCNVCRASHTQINDLFKAKSKDYYPMNNKMPLTKNSNLVAYITLYQTYPVLPAIKLIMDTTVLLMNLISKKNYIMNSFLDFYFKISRNMLYLYT